MSAANRSQRSNRFNVDDNGNAQTSGKFKAEESISGDENAEIDDNGKTKAQPIPTENKKSERKPFIFDSIKVHFSAKVFLWELIVHLFWPFLNWYSPIAHTHNVFKDFNIVVLLGVILPGVNALACIVSYCLIPNGHAGVLVPIMLHASHKVMVSLKYASMSPTEYKKIMLSRDTELVQIYQGQLQLLRGWMLFNRDVYEFEIYGAAARVGVNIDVLHYLIPDHDSNSPTHPHAHGAKRKVVTPLLQPTPSQRNANAAVAQSPSELALPRVRSRRFGTVGYQTLMKFTSAQKWDHFLAFAEKDSHIDAEGHALSAVGAPVRLSIKHKPDRTLNTIAEESEKGGEREASSKAGDMEMVLPTQHFENAAMESTAAKSRKVTIRTSLQTDWQTHRRRVSVREVLEPCIKFATQPDETARLNGLYISTAIAVTVALIPIFIQNPLYDDTIPKTFFNRIVIIIYLVSSTHLTFFYGFVNFQFLYTATIDTSRRLRLASLMSGMVRPVHQDYSPHISLFGLDGVSIKSIIWKQMMSGMHEVKKMGADMGRDWMPRHNRRSRVHSVDQSFNEGNMIRRIEEGDAAEGEIDDDNYSSNSNDQDDTLANTQANAITAAAEDDSEDPGFHRDERTGRRIFQIGADGRKFDVVECPEQKHMLMEEWHVPKVDFEIPQNVYAWMYTRLIIQNYGVRMLFRIMLYTGGIFLEIIVSGLAIVFAVLHSDVPFALVHRPVVIQCIILAVASMLVLINYILLGSNLNDEFGSHRNLLVLNAMRCESELAALLTVESDDSIRQAIKQRQQQQQQQHQEASNNSSNAAGRSSKDTTPQSSPAQASRKMMSSTKDKDHALVRFTDVKDNNKQDEEDKLDDTDTVQEMDSSEMSPKKTEKESSGKGISTYQQLALNRMESRFEFGANNLLSAQAGDIGLSSSTASSSSAAKPGGGSGKGDGPLTRGSSNNNIADSPEWVTDLPVDAVPHNPNHSMKTRLKIFELEESVKAMRRAVEAIDISNSEYTARIFGIPANTALIVSLLSSAGAFTVTLLKSVITNKRVL